MTTIKKRTVLKIQTNLNIINKPVEERNVVFLDNRHSIEKYNTTEIKKNKDNVLDYISKLISKNRQRNSATIKPTGIVKVKFNILL